MTNDKLTREQKESIGLLSIGTFLEYFDLMLYIHMAVLLNELFFPKYNPTSAALLASSVFCATFVARPVGALLFGYIGDTQGRKTSLVMTSYLMAASCFTVAILPTYAEIGVMASIVMVLCRIAQGMSSIGEIIGAEIYLTETIESNLKHPAEAVVGICTALGSTAALFVGTLCISYNLNWRIAFLFGTIMALIGLLGRKRLKETIDFVDFQRTSKIILDRSSILDDEDKKIIMSDPFFNQKTNKITALSYFLIVTPGPICFYITFIYCSSILKDSFGYTSAEIIYHNLFVSFAELLSLITLACLSYKIYPLFILKIKFIIFLFLAILFPYLLDNVKTPSELMLLQLVFYFFTPSQMSANPIFFKYFAVPRRFTLATLLLSGSRAIMYIISSFGLIYLTLHFSNQGLLFILIPISIGFAFGLSHFIKLEKENDNFPTGWTYKPYVEKDLFDGVLEFLKENKKKSVRK